MDVPALYYNLGVSYFQSGDWIRSEEMFIRVSRFKEMESLAFYNLGLVNLKKKNDQKARSWFIRARESTNDSRLKAMSEEQLNRLKQLKEKWSSLSSVGLGYDSNVTLDNDTLTSVSSEPDNFLEFYGLTRGVLGGTSENGVIFKASLFGDIYQTLKDYNLIEANAGAYKTFSLGHWGHEAGGYITYSTLGGEGYLQSGNLSWAGGAPVTDQLRIRMRLRLRYVTSVDDQYSALDGTTEDFRVEGHWAMSSSSQVRGVYQLEFNDRNGWDTETSFISLSPTRNTFKLEYARLFDDSWAMVIAGSYRNSYYAQANLETNGTSINRRDDRLRTYLEFKRTLSRHTNLSLEYTYTDNRSNINQYAYVQNIILANLQFLF
jgi:hypothetical protein